MEGKEGEKRKGKREEGSGREERKGKGKVGMGREEKKGKQKEKKRKGIEGSGGEGKT